MTDKAWDGENIVEIGSITKRLTGLNESIAEVKGWTIDPECSGEVHLSSPSEWVNRCFLTPEGKVGTPPNYTGSLEASDGLLEEMRAKGCYVERTMFPDGSDVLKWCDIPEEWNSLTTSTGGKERTFLVICAEAWLAVFGG